MLENFPLNSGSNEVDTYKRVLAMAAALEIAKASAGASTDKTSSEKVAKDLQSASNNIEELADKILNYIKK